MKIILLWVVPLLSLGGTLCFAPAEVRCEWLSRIAGLVVAFAILAESWPVPLKPVDQAPFWTHKSVRHAVIWIVVGTILWAVGEPLCRVVAPAK